MNKVILIGNLTRDPELTETPNRISVCRFTVAVGRSYTTSGEKKTDFFNCTAWRGLGESVSKYCVKGSKVAVSGSIELRQYEDNKGNKQNTVDVIVQEVEFLSSKNRNGDDDLAERKERIGNSIDSYENRKSGAKKPTQRQMQVFDDDGDIPF